MLDPERMRLRLESDLPHRASGDVRRTCLGYDAGDGVTKKRRKRVLLMTTMVMNGNTGADSDEGEGENESEIEEMAW